MTALRPRPSSRNADLSLRRGARRIAGTCLLVGCTHLAVVGCDEPAPLQSKPSEVLTPKRPALYEAVELTEQQLASQLKHSCELAVAGKQPVLVEFSAPWCKDCLRLQAMKKQPPLREALDGVQQVTINVGEFDRHRTLINAFAVRAIARWELLAPSDCSVDATHWTRLGGRTLEPETGQPVDAAALSEWLQRLAG